ncbi:MFS transporter [Prosthecomicrobium sp. N25]|uniref:MFS transporter n=1 Tax=Prosthecomicrobium sp. N25 TaxID=3129254 RepID=UPI003077760C
MPNVSGPVRRTGVLAATIMASSMAFIDGSVVQIALPAVQRDLGADFASLQWVVGFYNLMLGALVLVGGALGDAVGRRRVFLAGTLVLVASSLACGLAPSAPVLVAGRAVQGVGAALMIPQSLALIAATHPEEIRGRAIGTWAAASALTTAFGPPVGGFMVDALSWRAAFLVNLPVGLVALWMTLRFVPESRAEPARPVDWVAGLLAAAGLGALTAALIHAPGHGLADPSVLAGLALAAVALPAFLAWEARAAAPMVPLGLFRNRAFALLNLLTLLLYGALSGALFVVPYTLVGLGGYGAAEAGTAMLPMALAIGLLSRSFGALSDRVGARPLLALGSAVVAASMLWLAATGTGGGLWVGVVGPLLGIGFGMAMVVSPLTTAVMTAIGDALSGTASGINNAAARVAGLLAVAVTGALAVALYAPRLAAGLAAAGLEPAVTAGLLAEADRLLDLPALASLPEPSRTTAETSVRAAYLYAFTLAVAANAALAGLAAVVALWLPRSVPVSDRSAKAVTPSNRSEHQPGGEL